jgi:carbon starvation protein
VACGACSGFHGIVCSGTTSKQIAKETDCLPVGYGGMLLEGLVAFLALATVMILVPGSALTSASPDRIYAEGLGRLVQHLGLPHDLARAFVLLAFTTFIYDTLDVATRLARYILQELTGWKGFWGSLHATWISLVIPLLCLTVQMTDSAGHAIPAWKVFWTLFGTSNQLLAALTLMILSVWLLRTGKPWWISALPMAFMLVMTFWSLHFMASPMLARLSQGNFAPDPVGLVAIFLFFLAVLLIFEAFWAVFIRKEKVEL